jgi:hypothetical protein
MSVTAVHALMSYRRGNRALLFVLCESRSGIRGSGTLETYDAAETGAVPDPPRQAATHAVVGQHTCRRHVQLLQVRAPVGRWTAAG